MMKVLMLPTWVTVRAIVPLLPLDHPYRIKKPSLTEWIGDTHDFPKSLNIFFSIAFWAFGIFITSYLLKVIL